MGLPRKPKGVLDLKEESELRKERTGLEKPSKLGNMTLDQVPGGKYELVTKTRNITKYRDVIEWYKKEFRDRGPQRGYTLKRVSPRGKEATIGLIKKTKRVPYTVKEKYREWVWKDPHKNTREKLHEMETKRINRINSIDKRLREPLWGRTRKNKITNRPGTRGRKTILTGGFGIKQEEENTPLLFRGGKIRAN